VTLWSLTATTHSHGLYNTLLWHPHNLYLHSIGLYWLSHASTVTFTASTALSQPLCNKLRLDFFKHYLMTFKHSHGFLYTLIASFGTLLILLLLTQHPFALSRPLLAYWLFQWDMIQKLLHRLKAKGFKWHNRFLTSN
jgi:cellulose synthase/poly-beta-1,6-N-acetylglucosamine synthase-like glycosyltransferase